METATAHTNRPAFTLIEPLVVVAIRPPSLQRARAIHLADQAG